MFEIKLIFYGLSSMLQFSHFVWPLSYSVWDVFNNFLLIDAADRIKISSDLKRFFIALSLHPLSFFAYNPFNTTTFIQNCIYIYIYEFSYKFDTLLYQFLETGTSDRCFIYIVQLLRFSGFILYPHSFLLYSPFNNWPGSVMKSCINVQDGACKTC